MQKEFLPIVEELEYKCRVYFAERLCSAYLHGSIDKQDAVYGISDLDYYLILYDDIRVEDLAWSRKITKQLQNRHKSVEEIHLSIQSIEDIKREPFTRFILAYNATLRMGEKIEDIQEKGKLECFCPDKYLAKWRLAFARRCFEDALQKRQPACTGVLPTNTYYSSRKIARYFVVVEGAYFLMTRNMFSGFGKECVLTQLREEIPSFQSILNMVESVLNDPIDIQMDHDTLLKEIKPLVSWMFDEIERA